MKKSFFFIVSLFVILFSSCQNFMDAGNIQKEIEDIITEANAKSIKLVISQDTTMGTFLSSGEKECKLGYSINVQFNLKKEAYIFKGLKAVSTSGADISRKDYVEFKIKDRDDEKGIYKVEIKVVKDVDDLMIMPDCILVPGVVKENCLPVYSDAGCEQDSTIVIAFNKPVETTENFTLSITDVSGNSLSDYFIEPYFSSDSKTLYIPTNKDLKLLDINGTTNNKDIFVKFDLSNIVDEEGNTGNNVFQYKYRVNKQTDSVSPVLKNVRLYSTNDTSSKYYKEILSKNSTQWTAADYSAYHVGRTIYIELEGTDIGAGIGNVLVKEKLLSHANGTSVSETNSAVKYHAPCQTNLETGIHYCTYKFNTSFDGILELEIYAEDYSQNSSTEKKTFWILKDTIIDSSNIKFKEEVTPPGMNMDPSVFLAWEAALLKKIPSINGSVQNVELSLDESEENGKKVAQDYFYDNYYTSYDISIYWGETEGSIVNPIPKINNKYSFTRTDLNKFAFIKIICKDAVGNEKEIIKLMAPQPEMISGETPQQYSISNLPTQILQGGLSLPDGQISASDYSYVVFDFVADDDPETNSFCVARTQSPNILFKFIEIIGEKFGDNTDNYPTGHLKASVFTSYANFPSVLSSNCMEGTITEWGEIQDEFGNIMTGPIFAEDDPLKISTESTLEILHTVNGYGPENQADYISRNPLTLKISPVTNSGCYKVKIDNYATQAGIDAKINYSIYVLAYTRKNPDSTDLSYYSPNSFLTRSPEFFLQSMVGYRFYIEAYDPATKTQYCPIQYSQFVSTGAQNHGETPIIPDNLQSFSFNIINTDGETLTETPTQTFLMKEDVMPPKVSPSIVSNIEYELGSPGGFGININDDANDPFLTENERNNLDSNSNLPKDENGYYELTYYIIPNPSNIINFTPTYSANELKNEYALFARKLICPDISNNTYVNIPYGNLEGGFYTISFVPEDIYGNSEVYTYTFFNTVFGNLEHEFGRPEFREENNIRIDYVPFFVNKDMVSAFEFEIDSETNQRISNPKITIRFDTLQDYNTYMPDNAYWNGYSNENDRYEFITKINQYTGEEETYAELECTEQWPWRRLRAYQGYGIDDNNIDGKGSYYYDYVFLGKDPNCLIKNCIDGLNGMQIWTDNSFFVHTMYSTEKLTNSTKTKDACAIWETKGVETGLEAYDYVIDFNDIANSEHWHDVILNKTYKWKNLDEIPIGCYYTTIVHFADGTVVMTDIKQK